MQDLENHYGTRLQGIRRQGGTVQVYANIPLPLASALDLESGETVTWKVLDRTHLLLVRLPERKQLKGEAVPQPSSRKRARRNREQMFRDEDFAALYCPDNGRQSVPPSVAVSVLFLRAYEGVSFAEAVERTKYDLRWKVALGLEMEEVPMQKSALQEFEAKLVLHEMEEPILQKSIEEARRAGYLKSGKIRVALDTTPILGKGAVKDTYNLLAEGIEQLVRRLAEVEGEEVMGWAERQGFSRYFGSSLKGEAAIDWDHKAQREQLLTERVQDGRRLLGLAEQGKEQHPEQVE